MTAVYKKNEMHFLDLFIKLWMELCPIQQMNNIIVFPLLSTVNISVTGGTSAPEDETLVSSLHMFSSAAILTRDYDWLPIILCCFDRKSVRSGAVR